MVDLVPNEDAFSNEELPEFLIQVHKKMHEKPGYEDIGHGILAKKNFLDLTDLNFIKYQAEDLPEENWNTHPVGSYFQGKISTNLKVEHFISTFIDEIMPEYWTNEHKSVNRVRPGDDLKTFGQASWIGADYLAIFYFGTWEGGELVLLEKDGQEINFEFKPEENTLYILPILEDQLYTSKPVTSGIKYSHIDWVYRHGDWFLA